MGKFFNLDAPVIRFLGTVGEIMMLTVLWLVCCLPFFTVGAATAAMYRMMFNLKEDGSTKISDFFRAFKENFKKGTLLWFTLLAVVALLAVVYWLIAWVENDMIRLVLLVVFLQDLAVFPHELEVLQKQRNQQEQLNQQRNGEMQLEQVTQDNLEVLMLSTLQPNKQHHKDHGNKTEETSVERTLAVLKNNQKQLKQLQLANQKSDNQESYKDSVCLNKRKKNQ